MSQVIMERRFAVAPTEDELEAMKARTEACLAINDASRIQTFASPDGTRFICLFEGRDLESVRRAVESAGIEYESIWAATTF